MAGKAAAPPPGGKPHKLAARNGPVAAQHAQPETRRPPDWTAPRAAFYLDACPDRAAVADCSRDQYNCGDFSTCAEVMAVFNACPGDPNRLDGDHDGTPCEAFCK